MGVSVIEGVSSPGITGDSLSVGKSAGGVEQTFIPHPLLQMPLNEDLRLIFGTGSAIFTRATTGTSIDKDDRLLKTASTNVARFESNGVLIEGVSTNLRLHSEDLSNAVWSVAQLSSPITDGTLGPDGITQAWLLVEDTSVNTTHFISQANSFTVGVTYTHSMFDRSGIGTRNVRTTLPDAAFPAATFALFDFSTGTITSTGAGAENSSVIASNNGWFRVNVTSTADITTSPNTVIFMADGNSVTYTGDGVSSIYLIDGQIEALPFASSYIPTTTIPVTRALDDLSIPSSNIPAPTADYTVHMIIDVLGLDSTKNQVIFNVDGETTRKIEINTTTGVIEATHGAVTSSSTTAITPGTPMEITFVVDSTNQTLYIDKVQEDQDVKGTVTGTATRLSIGNAAGSDQLFGNMKPLEIFDEALTDTQQARL